MAQKFTRICVFCASSMGDDPAFVKSAQQMGNALADRGIGLVYGGGNVGLMGVVADSVMKRGGEVIGVIPRMLVDKELAHHGVSELRVVGSMHERKAVMAELADGFVALPGGFGTLEEFFEVLTWGQLGMHKKPCGLLNVQKFYDHLLTFLDHVVQSQLLRQKNRELILVSTDPGELLDTMQAWQPTLKDKLIKPSET